MLNTFNKKQFALFALLVFCAIITGTVMVDRNLKKAEETKKAAAGIQETSTPAPTPNPTPVQPTDDPATTLMPELMITPEVAKPFTKPSVSVKGDDDDDDEHEDDD